MTEIFYQLYGPLDDDLDPETLTGLAGLVVDAHRVTPDQCQCLPVPVVALNCRAGTEEVWDVEQDPLRVVDGGLDECARLRDAKNDLKWLPRLEVFKPDVVYRMSAYPGEGFKFYAPDTAAIRGYRVKDGDLALHHALQRARELGFERIWLHACDAARRGDGLDLELLAQARRWFDDGLWFSGGATDPNHLRNLAREGGVPGLVIDANLLTKFGIAELVDALTPPPPPEVPIHFERRRGGDSMAD